MTSRGSHRPSLRTIARRTLERVLANEDRREILDRLDRGEISWEEAQARLRGEKYVEPRAPEVQEGK